MSLENNRKGNNKEGTIRFPIWADNGALRTIEYKNNKGTAHWCPRSDQVMRKGVR